MRGLRMAQVFLFLSMAAGVAAAAPLGPSTEELRRIDVGSIDRPEADAVILYRGVHVRLDADGRVTRRVRLVQRLMTDHAISIGGDPRVAYDTTRQELSIEVCRTFMLDGREVKAAPHAFNRVTPERVASCPDRVGLQEMVISHVGVERGCLTELDYTLTDRIAWQPWLEGIEELGGPYPVQSGELWIETPAGAEIHAQTSGWREQVDRAAGPFCVPMAKPWSYGPIPVCPDEGGLPAMERVPVVIYSTGSWRQLAASVHERIAAAAAPDSSIRAWARGKLRSGRLPLDDAERLERVASLIGERTMEANDVPLSWLLPIRPASRTFDTSCGNLLDRAALGLAALRASGIEATIELHPIGRSVATSPVLACFDDVRLVTSSGVLSVREGRAAAWIDPSPATSLFAIDGAGAGIPRPVTVPGVVSRLSLHIALSADGSVRGEASIDARGAFVAGLGIEDLKGYLEGLASGYVIGGELAGYRVEEAAAMSLRVLFSFTGKAVGESLGGGRRAFVIPSAPGLPGEAIAPNVSYARDIRRTPLILGRSVEEDVTVRLELPEATRPVVSPSVGEWKGLPATLETSWTREGDAWVYHRRFRVEEGSVAPTEYPALRAVLIGRLGEAANCLVLTTGRTK